MQTGRGREMKIIVKKCQDCPFHLLTDELYDAWRCILNRNMEGRLNNRLPKECPLRAGSVEVSRRTQCQS
jgi:hypothetical protein